LIFSFTLAMTEALTAFAAAISDSEEDRKLPPVEGC
jgi:hypothetical protein